MNASEGATRFIIFSASLSHRRNGSLGLARSFPGTSRPSCPSLQELGLGSCSLESRMDMESAIKPSPHHERTVLPCSRFVTHMKNFSKSHKCNNLHFPERTQSPVTCERLLHTCQPIIPRSSVSTDSFEEENRQEACSTPASCGERDEDSLSLMLREKVPKTISKTSKQTWSIPFFAPKMANKPSLPHSEHPVYLEATSRHTRLQNQSLSDSKGNSRPPGRPSTAIGLCRTRSRSAPPSARVEERAAVTVDFGAHPDSPEGLPGAPGNAAGRGAVAMVAEMLPKHPRVPEEPRLRADASLSSLWGNLAEEPLPGPAGASTHFHSKRLIKVCTAAPPRPPRPFHTACSQAFPRPVVNAHLR
uniref:uncharacterized protein C12orf42 homolog isoform X2 n=2 Tax=Ictidomys tridecemlineatus TaxID=43179 RepID=UPI001AA00214|nr:uncharacterized protein C12orf42 homolog isoform X2 [Ictidomys tridecemlineatus]